MSIDFYDKQPLCVINSRIKKYSILISCSPSVRMLSIGLGRYYVSDWAGWADAAAHSAWLWGYLCYVH